MKKEFETPEINVIMFNVVDVITTSSYNPEEDGKDEGPGDKGEFPIG